VVIGDSVTIDDWRIARFRLEFPGFSGDVGGLELLGAQPAEMTVAARPIVERLDIVGHLRDRQLPVLVDQFLDPFLLQAAEKDSATALSQQFPFRLMLGSSRFVRQRRTASKTASRTSSR